ncbi:AzlD domain-containing protein [Dactylosporangium sp. NPDC051541]|uniref:AzlD domain-containing protein n=1 Tax=Dactylosporangium sp. NPDC051541 TaxID=3363977 RepID=UPI0037B2C7CE
MTAMIAATIALAALNILYKAIGPALLGGREFPPEVQAVADALPVVLLAGLLTVDLLGAGWRDFDWTALPGLAAAVALRWWGRSHLLCIVAAVAVTAGLRYLLGILGG